VEYATLAGDEWRNRREWEFARKDEESHARLKRESRRTFLDESK
jgi:hypothetical protein